MEVINGVDVNAEEVGVVADAVAEVIRETKDGAAVVELGERDAAVAGHHEELLHGEYSTRFQRKVDGSLFEEEGLH